MVRINRTDWSNKRVRNFFAASITTALILGFSAAPLAAGRALPSWIWLVAFANVVQWLGYVATTMRDDMRQEMSTTLREQIQQEVSKLLKPIDSKIEELDADVSEYGDRREAAGTALALKIVGRRGDTNGRHLNPVD